VVPYSSATLTSLGAWPGRDPSAAGVDHEDPGLDPPADPLPDLSPRRFGAASDSAPSSSPSPRPGPGL
jgi:hypothetical protein